MITKLAALGSVAGYALLQWLGRTYGSTVAERHTAMPGDEVQPEPQYSITHGITIDATPEDVWPWLVQVGWHRAGWYTARWVDQLLFPANSASADSTLPELQHCEGGIHPRWASGGRLWFPRRAGRAESSPRSAVDNAPTAQMAHRPWRATDVDLPPRADLQRSRDKIRLPVACRRGAVVGQGSHVLGDRPGRRSDVARHAARSEEPGRRAYARIPCFWE